MKIRLTYTSQAIDQLEKIKDVLMEKNPVAGKRVIEVIRIALGKLAQNPELGRPMLEFLGFRELVIGFGNQGYVVKYHYLSGADVVVLAIRHQREAGYDFD